VQDIDIMTVTDAELDFVSPFSLIVSSSNPDETCTLGALVLYFDTSFEAGCKQPHVVLDTSPQTEPTHWKQVHISPPPITTDSCLSFFAYFMPAEFAL
jgi:hypothetical protein